MWQEDKRRVENLLQFLSTEKKLDFKIMQWGIKPRWKQITSKDTKEAPITSLSFRTWYETRLYLEGFTRALI